MWLWGSLVLALICTIFKFSYETFATGLIWIALIEISYELYLIRKEMTNKEEKKDEKSSDRNVDKTDELNR